MKSSTKTLIAVLTLIGVILGAAIGFLWPQVMLAISIIGKLYIASLTFFALPLILFSMATAVSLLGRLDKLSRIGKNALVYFAITGVIAVVIGIGIVVAIDPGGLAEGQSLSAPSTPDIATDDNLQFYLSRIPDIGIQGLARGQYVGLVFLALAAGAILVRLGKRMRSMARLFREADELVSASMRYLLYATPIGLFSLAGTQIALEAAQGNDLFEALGWYVAAVTGGLVGLAIVLIAALVVFSQRPALAVLASLRSAFVTALGTGSSAYTFPVTYAGFVDDSGVDQRSGALMLPTATILNVSATALVLVIATAFLVEGEGIALSLPDLCLIGLASLVASIGLAGLPHITFAGLLFVGGVLGMPEATGIGLAGILATEWLTDRMRAVVNVLGDATGAAVLAESLEFKTARGTEPVRSRRPDRVRDDRPPRGSDESSSRDRRDDRGGRGRTRQPRRASVRSGERQSRDSRSGAPRSSDRSDRTDRSERSYRSDRTERSERTERSDRSERADRPVRSERSTSRSSRSPFEVTESSAPFVAPEPGDPGATSSLSDSGRVKSGGSAPSRAETDPSADSGRSSPNRRGGGDRSTRSTRNSRSERSRPDRSESSPRSRPSPPEETESSGVGDFVDDESHGRFTKADIARELARVSRQLTDSIESTEEAEASAERSADLDQSDGGEEMPPIEAQETKSEEDDKEAFVPRTRRRTSRRLSRSEQVDADESGTAEPEPPEGGAAPEPTRSPEDNGGHDRSTAGESDESSSEDHEEADGGSEQHFGRRKLRKGTTGSQASESKDEPSASQQDTPGPVEPAREEAEEFAEPGQITFGRGPKRRS